MIRKMSWLGLVALLGMVGLVLPSAAEAPKGDDAAKQEAHAGDVEMLAEAYQVAEIAEKQKLPEAYVTAGSLVLKFKAATKGDLGKLDLKPEILDENGKPVKNAKVESAKTESLDNIAKDFFDRASTLALEQGTSTEVESLIKAAKARKHPGRGASGGPKLFARSLGAKRTHVYSINVDTFAVFAVGFQASAPTHAKMQIGDHVHFDQTVTTGNYSFKPKANAAVKTYTITVYNPEKFPVTYRLWTN